MNDIRRTDLVVKVRGSIDVVIKFAENATTALYFTAMQHVPNNSVTTSPIHPQPTVHNRSTATQCIHCSQENDPLPVTASETIMEPSMCTSPLLAMAHRPPKINVSVEIYTTLNGTGDKGYFADIDLLVKDI